MFVEGSTDVLFQKCIGCVVAMTLHDGSRPRLERSFAIIAAAVGGSSAEARDDLLGNASPSSAAAAAVAEEAAMAQAGSGSCGIGLPSMMIGDNLVISVVSGGCAAAANASPPASASTAAGPTSAHSRTNSAAASAADSRSNGQVSGASPTSRSTNGSNNNNPTDGKSSTRPNNNKTNGNNRKGTHNADASNGMSHGGPSPHSTTSRAQHNPLEQPEEEEEGLFDWVGSSIQSAYDAMFPPTDEEGNANNGNGNAEGNGNGGAAAASPLTAQTQEGAHPPPSSSTTSRGVSIISSKKGNYLKSGGKSPVSFASHTHADMPAAEDDSSPVRATSRTNRGYRRAQTAPPPTSTSMSPSTMDHADPSTRRRGSGSGGATLQTAASIDSIDSRGRRRKKSSKLLPNRSSAAAGKSRVAASLKMSRSRSDNNKGADGRIGSGGVGRAGEGTAPSPSKAASFDVAAAGSRDEQDSGSGLRLPSLRPPLGPRLGNGRSSKRDGGGSGGGGTISWTMMHDKLIDELFEASRRQYIATHFGDGEGGQNGHHHHLHEKPKEKEQKEHSGWKLRNLLSGGGGGGNDADVVGGKSKKNKGNQTSNLSFIWATLSSRMSSISF